MYKLIKTFSLSYNMTHIMSRVWLNSVCLVNTLELFQNYSSIVYNITTKKKDDFRNLLCVKNIFDFIFFSSSAQRYRRTVSNKTEGERPRERKFNIKSFKTLKHTVKHILRSTFLPSQFVSMDFGQKEVLFLICTSRLFLGPFISQNLLKELEQRVCNNVE